MYLIYHHHRSDRALPNLSRILQLVRVVLVVGIIFAVIGGLDQAPGNSASKANSGHNLTKIGTALFLGGYVAIFATHVLLWTVKSELPVIYRRVSSVQIHHEDIHIHLIYEHTLFNQQISSCAIFLSPSPSSLCESPTPY